MYKVIFICLLLFVSLVVTAEEYSPGVGRDYPTRLLWGDTHLHSNLSADAYSFGNKNKSPDEAFRYAKGELLVSSNGTPAKLARPLDFLVVSDHAAFMGIFVGLDERDENILSSKIGQRWNAYIQADQRSKVTEEFVSSVSGGEAIQTDDVLKSSIWAKTVAIAERHNNPGVFTTLHGYEWTSISNGNNLHRVVLFKDDADKVAQAIPFSAVDSVDPEDLWDALDAYRKETGGTVMTIPHNGNLSNGLMFDTKRLNGKKYTRSYVKKRAYYERVYEVTQVKGDSEAHPYLSPNDEFADYYNWDGDNIGRTQEKKPEMLAGEYGRSALIRGLGLGKKYKTNPYKFGFIGSTDNHTGLAANDENNFFGKFKDSEPGQTRSENTMGEGGLNLWPNSELAASGYAAVWADENTREGIYSAMHRREVYATTGSRIYLRYFGGWSFTEDDLYKPEPVSSAYAKGVPMGGDLPTHNGVENFAPTILITAAKDPEGANLARVQVIKGWWSRDGKPHEKIYDVEIAYKQSDPNTVSLAEPTYRNTIGSPLISRVWSDPEFDPSLHAFYYVRAIEIPTPSWLAYDAAYYKYKPKPDATLIHQERAYGSPIWYTPER